MFGLFLVFILLATEPNAPVFAKEISLCTYPPYPKNGGYLDIDKNSTAVPGDIAHSYVLNVSCDPGYQLVGEEPRASCLQGWDSEMPECIPLCQLKTPSTISCGAKESTCYFQHLAGSAGDVSHRHLDGDNECGKRSPSNIQIIAGGTAAQEYEMPWHAGIYSKRFTPYMQICGGSLVSSKVVISAAHCFWDDIQHKLPAKNYAVAVGKIYRPWNDPNDDMVQKSDVSEIRIPPRFLGSATNFQEDLALLVLSEPVYFSTAVRPVCLDFDYKFDTKQLTTGALGKVSGWGLDGQDGRASPKLQVAHLPYIDITECVADSSPDFHSYLTSDKICAGYTNGTAVCKGDSGGGLSFLEKTVNGERYYLRGVVSAAQKTEHLCNVFRWATFTHLLRHQHFIQDVMGA